MKSNPFKLWGSYVGFLLGVLGIYLSFGLLWSIAQAQAFEPWGVLYMIALPIVGFIVGWKIHQRMNH